MRKYFIIVFIFSVQILQAQKVELKNLMLVTEKSIQFKNEDVKLKVRLLNKSKDTLYYASMSCSWQDFYSINNSNIHIEIPECDKNGPTVLVLAPNESHLVELTIKFDKKISTDFKVGLNIIQSKLLMHLEKNPDGEILWSSSIYIH